MLAITPASHLKTLLARRERFELPTSALERRGSSTELTSVVRYSRIANLVGKVRLELTGN